MSPLNMHYSSLSPLSFLLCGPGGGHVATWSLWPCGSRGHIATSSHGGRHAGGALIHKNIKIPDPQKIATPIPLTKLYLGEHS